MNNTTTSNTVCHQCRQIIDIDRGYWMMNGEVYCSYGCTIPNAVNLSRSLYGRVPLTDVGEELPTISVTCVDKHD